MEIVHLPPRLRAKRDHRAIAYRGRSLIEDEVIRYVVTGLRVIRSPDDPVALGAFARAVLSEHFLQEVLAATAAPPDSADFLESVRQLARRRPHHDPDTKKLWRFVYQVENLRALARSRHSVAALVDEILSQSIGPYRNVLEERHDELSDPLEFPGAVALAARLRKAIDAETPIVIEAQGGVGIALRGMLIAAGVRHVPRGMAPGSAETLRKVDSLTLFKALQVLHAGESTPLPRYVTFDFETTDKDVATCGVVEVGAARVVNGEIVDTYHTLVNPYQPIAAEATKKAHGYTDADVKDAPSFAEILPQFRAFVGDDILIAHNGQSFDIPVLRRLAAGREGVDDLVFYDTLPLVRSLSRESGSQENVAARLGIDVGRAHHALDDAVTLAKVYRELEKQRAVRARKAVLADVLDYLAIGMALEGDGPERSAEWKMLLDKARYRAMGRYSDSLEFYETEREITRADAPPIEELIDLLGGQALRTRLAADPDPSERYPAALARLRNLMEPSPPDPLSPSGRGGTMDQIDRLLERVALSSTSGGAEVSRNRVTLLTLHSTKGLEFSRVYVVGVEDYQVPGYHETEKNLEAEIAEARRLLYVGMTRARDRLVLTRVTDRFGRSSGGSRFLEEMGLAVTV